MPSTLTASSDSDLGLIVPDVVVDRVDGEFVVCSLPRPRVSDQRRWTLYWAMRIIVDRQREFFEFGERSLKPLTHREVAAAIGVHESTVSRVTNGRFVQTPRGVLPVKQFFSSSLDSADGAAISSRSIKAAIAAIVEAENPQDPLTDAAIAELLHRDGVSIARRTVAKYREDLGIPTLHARKQQRSAR